MNSATTRYIEAIIGIAKEIQELNESGNVDESGYPGEINKALSKIESDLDDVKNDLKP
jgi:uncharacterized protein Yka (UPF0111/DUF47 family)